MKHFAVVAFVAAAALAASGCATKKYVRNTTAPIQSKVDQVSETTTRQGQSIEENKAGIQENKASIQQVDQNAQTGISAAKEQAMTAQNRANDAMNKATEATDLGNRNTQEITSLRQVVSNLDDYKMQTETTIPFKFDKYTLTQQDKDELDKLVTNVGQYKRYFIAVEGFTDRTGSKQYNETLSRKRADAVVQYLVTKHDVPIYRIHTIGLGDQKPVDENRTRAARAKNRRVEVKVFSADQAMAAISQPQGQQNQPAQSQPEK